MLSRQAFSCGKVYCIPCFARQIDLCCFHTVLKARRVHGAGYRLHLRGVPQQPGHDDRGVAHIVFFCQLIDFRVELREFLNAEEHTFKTTVLEG